MRQTRIAVVLVLGIVLGTIGASVVRPAQADQSDDLHRIAQASERIAHLLEKCPR
jgi:hypothetical protein